MVIKKTINFSNYGSRNSVRKRVIKTFMQEKPGTGKGDNTSKYHYNVEKLSNGNWIYLTRPANLKNGFDFRINVENVDFSKGTGKFRVYPTHGDISDDLLIKKIMIMFCTHNYISS